MEQCCCFVGRRIIRVRVCKPDLHRRIANAVCVKVPEVGFAAQQRKAQLKPWLFQDIDSDHKVGTACAPPACTGYGLCPPLRDPADCRSSLWITVQIPVCPPRAPQAPVPVPPPIYKCPRLAARLRVRSSPRAKPGGAAWFPEHSHKALHPSPGMQDSYSCSKTQKLARFSCPSCLPPP